MQLILSFFADFVFYVYVHYYPSLLRQAIHLKQFIRLLSFVAGTITVSVLDVRQFLEVKISTSVFPNSSDSLF